VTHRAKPASQTTGRKVSAKPMGWRRGDRRTAASGWPRLGALIQVFRAESAWLLAVRRRRGVQQRLGERAAHARSAAMSVVDYTTGEHRTYARRCVAAGISSRSGRLAQPGDDLVAGGDALFDQEAHELLQDLLVAADEGLEGGDALL
jgi:hypothetical protein